MACSKVSCTKTKIICDNSCDGSCLWPYHCATVCLDFGPTPVGIVAVVRHAVSRLPLTEEVRARYQATVCGICGEQELHLETGRS